MIRQDTFGDFLTELTDDLLDKQAHNEIQNQEQATIDKEVQND